MYRKLFERTEYQIRMSDGGRYILKLAALCATGTREKNEKKSRYKALSRKHFIDDNKVSLMTLLRFVGAFLTYFTAILWGIFFDASFDIQMVSFRHLHLHGIPRARRRDRGLLIADSRQPEIPKKS